MTTRRNFIKKSGLVMGGLAFPNVLLSCKTSNSNNYKPGLQLYTIRKAMKKNPKKSLEKVADIGYKVVETATYTGTQKFYGMDASEFSSVLKENGLQASSGHYQLGNSNVKGTILNGWEQAIEDAHKAGLKYMVCAYLPEEQRGSLDVYKKRADQFNKAGEACKDAGIQFCYHNHAFEFEEENGQTPYDILLSETDKDLMKMEMDIYWVARAGLNPLDLIDADPGRYVLWHVKDMDNTEDQNFAEVGNGIIDWPSIFENADKSGLQQFFVEQDQTSGDPFDSIKQSIDYLNNKILS